MLLTLFGLVQTGSALTFGDFSYTDDGSSVTITGYPTTGTGAITVPDTIDGMPVTAIGYRAFFNCSGLVGISIPSSVTNIAAEAFSKCSVLSSVTVPAGVTVISDGLFSGCVSLASVNLAGNVTAIGSRAFFNCSGLVGISIPSSVTNIAAEAFSQCSGLSSVTVPAGVTVISDGLFSGCTSLASVNLGGNVTAIGDRAFFNCSGLVGISIPASVTSIGVEAFYHCSGLTSMALPSGVTVILRSAFDGCTSLVGVTLTGNVTGIERYAFYNCTSLTGFSLPSSVVSVGDFAFSKCANLETVSLSAVLESIGASAFADCTKLAAVDLSGTALKSLGISAFSKCNALTSVAVPSTLDGIPSLAFDACASLAAVTIPEGVLSLGSGAFRLCPLLTSIHLPASLTTVDCNSSNNGQPFNRCNSLTSISVSPTNPAFVSVGGVLFNAAKTQLYAYPAGLNDTAYAIPQTVQTIKHSALRGGKFTTVTISSSVSSIENSAFSSCSQLVSATFAGNAPASANFGSSVFNLAAPGFTVYFYAGATGFSTPKWPAVNGYSSVQIGSLSPVQSWLKDHGLPLDINLGSDPNGDGVSLLMAYALNLDPNQNLSGSLPVPQLSAGQLTMSFYAGTSGVVYGVETSADMTNWTTSGVTIFAPDINGVRSATVSADGSSRFMRLVVRY